MFLFFSFVLKQNSTNSRSGRPRNKSPEASAENNERDRDGNSRYYRSSDRDREHRTRH